MSDKYPGGFVTANAPAGFSVAFDGNGDSVTAPQGSAFQFPADFTIECWVFANSSTGGASYDGVFDTRSGNVASSNSAGINYKPDGYLNMYVGGNNAASSVLLGASRWVHVALVRSGSSVVMYQNGVSVATTTTSANLSDGYCTIGGFVAGGYWNGYISNVRVVKGTALYTATFTPPTQLFPVTNTQLLTCQSPTIIDNSGNSVVLTVNGNAAPSNFTPFAAYQGFNPALGAAAGGVWTLDEAAYYQNNRQWPIYDPYFKNTTLMLHGNGTNAAQNNTFLDSSTNNFPITRNGNTTQGSFSPFSQTGWSYNGTAGAYCQLNNADYAIGTGDFTIEFWMYCVDDSSYGSSAFAGLPGGGVLTVSMSGGSSNARQPYLEFGGTSVPFGTLYGYLNKWTHIAYVRTSGYVVVYQNGVATAAPISKSQSFPNCANLYLARLPTDTGQDFRGYLSNYRITKAAVYSSNFTPSTTPLVPVSNTVLLTFQSNSFVDNSALRATVTPAGTASVQAFSPFVPAYITPTTYSNWFDGSGDYLQIASATALQLNTSVAWTIEAWVYPTTLSGDNGIIAKRSGGSTEWQFSHSAGTGLTLYTGATTYFSGQTLTANKFQHVAVTWDLTTLRFFIDGVQTPTTNTGISLPASNTYPVNIASNTAGGETWYGCISNLRLVKGTALYTASFTPPTAPLTNITNTSLLTCQSSTFVDNSTNAYTITATGNVQPVTSPTPFPAKVDTTTLNSAYSTSLIGGSAYFDGASDYLNLASNAAFSLGTGDFTIETFAYYSSFTQVDAIAIINWDGGTWSANNWSLHLDHASQRGRVTFWVNNINVGSPILSSGTALVANNWYHIAVTRSGSTWRLFINGVIFASTTSSASIDGGTNPPLYIGGSGTTATQAFNGYLSGMRLVKGTALYTQAFTPPLTPLTAVSGTSLLTNFTNGAIFDNTAKNVLETAGGAALSSTQAKYGTTSMYFDGSGDWLVAANGRNFINGTEPFTIECWVYITGTPNYWSICGAGGGTLVLTIQNLTTININPYGSGNTLSVTTSLSINTWTHIAATRNSANRFDIWVNGVSAGNTTSSQSFGSPTYYAIGAADSSTTQPFIGYLDDVRITKACRYFGTFTPPTSQLQDQ